MSDGDIEKMIEKADVDNDGWFREQLSSSEYLIILFKGASTSGSLRRCSKIDIFIFYLLSYYHYLEQKKDYSKAPCWDYLYEK